MRAQRKYHYMRVPLSRSEEVPEAMFDLAHKRIEYLALIAMGQSLRYLLASAYLQGINDAISAQDALAERQQATTQPPVKP